MFRKRIFTWTSVALGLITCLTALAQVPSAPSNLSTPPTLNVTTPRPPEGTLTARLQDPPPPPPVTNQNPLAQPPTAPIQAAPSSATQAPVAPSAPTAPVAPSAPVAPAQATTGAGAAESTVQIGGGAPGTAVTGGSPAQAAASAQTLNAPDVGGLLAKSESATGVEVQRRNAIIVDPRLRGLRNGQFLTLGDGAPFYPARLDLDTPVSKFDPGTVNSVNVIRGPYSARLGPGFGFLEILTVPTPRATDGKQYIYGGTTSLGYQTNGSQWNGLQSAYMAGEDWGFRGTYNVQQGSDYRAGDGTKIPASYLSHNFNFGLGYSVSPNTNIEFRGLRSWIQNVEFPGLFFDIGRSDTEAYNLQLTSKDVGPFDLFSGSVWYNGTSGNGNTQGGAKQFFVQNLLGSAFAQGRPGILNPGPGVNGSTGMYSPFVFQDNSTSTFAERSIGYRFAGQWGNNKDQLTITAGTDLNAFGQSLTENINFNQVGGNYNARTGFPLATSPYTDPSQSTFIQQQSIPQSNSVDAGLFSEAMLPVDDYWKLKSGGRVDFVRASSNPRQIGGNIDLFGVTPQVPPAAKPNFGFDPILYSTNPNDNRLDRNFVLLSGFMTSEYKLSKETTMFMGYGYSERAPTLTELYASGPFIGVLQQGTSRLIGDPNLKKEQLNQFDLGLRYNSEWINAGVSGFYSLINNYITYDANKTSTTGLTQVVFTNTNLATLAGTEMYLQANVNRWLSPFATLAYVQGVDQTHATNNRSASLASSRRNDPATGQFATQTEALPQIPPMETRLGFRIHEAVDYNVSPKWQVELGARIVNGQNNIATSLGEIATPGFTTFDIRGFWKVSKGWLLTAGVENIGNKLYREHLDPVASNLLQGATNIPVAPLYRPGTNFFFASQLTY